MTQINAPYNFVPLSDKVFFPDWSHFVTQDIPFKEGLCGTLEVEYTAATNIFTGSGKTNGENEKEFYCSPSGKKALAGSSLRGMCRNIIEIASFGKFKRVQNRAMSVRDLKNPDLYNNKMTSTISTGTYKPLAKAGFLKFNDGEWFLTPCEYARVEQTVLEKFFGINLRKRQEPVGRNAAINLEKFHCWAQVELESKHKHSMSTLVYSKVNDLSAIQVNGYTQGRLVITGQPSDNNGDAGKKHMEFFFHSKKSPIKISEETALKKLLEVEGYDNPSLQKESQLYKLLNIFGNTEDGLGVFYIKEDNQIKSIGLSQMFRLPYEYDLHDAIRNSSLDHLSDGENRDLAELIFGVIEDKKNEGKYSLKGRVQFEDAEVTGEAHEAIPVDTILNTPKPTYYPNYIKQELNSGKYKTLMDADAKLRGWKRYPVRKTVNPIVVGAGQGKLAVRFRPLKAGTTFKGKIHFHNLLPQELGAIIWALTFGGKNNLHHSVGMAKPYGFGEISAVLKSAQIIKNDDLENKEISYSNDAFAKFRQDFVDEMIRFLPNWENSEQLKELFKMADPEFGAKSVARLVHMTLAPNEFTSNKKEKNFLPDYSDFPDANPSVRNVTGHYPNNFKKKGNDTIKTGNGLKSGDIVTCILLEEKTKKGGWKVSLQGNQISGTIVNTNDIPADKKAGDTIKLKITSINGTNSIFKYEG